MMKTSLTLVLLCFLAMTACFNNHAKKDSPKVQRDRLEENIDQISIDKKAKLPKESIIDDSLFLKRIIEGSFFESKMSERHDYVLVTRHCMSHKDEQYDEVFADGLNHMLRKFPQKIEGLHNAMEMLSPAQRKIAYDNMITYIVSSWVMEQNSDSLDIDIFYQAFPFFKNNSAVDSILIDQYENYKN